MNFDLLSEGAPTLTDWRDDGRELFAGDAGRPTPKSSIIAEGAARAALAGTRWPANSAASEALRGGGRVLLAGDAGRELFADSLSR